MDVVLLLRTIAALAVTVGLIGVAGWAMRRFGPETLAKLQSVRKERRLSLVEILPLDPSRRLVLVSLDGEERLILLGEGRMLETLKPPRPRKTPAPTAATPETIA